MDNSRDAVIIRAFDCKTDGESVCSLDTRIESAAVFHAECTGGSLCLKVVPTANPVCKDFPIDLDCDDWRVGYVAERSNQILGFVATAYQEWNRRLTIWHYYVDTKCRRQGVGRLLMEKALETGRNLGAVTAWIETSSLNHTGVEVYRRLGFTLCGFDLSLYKGTPNAGEFALFLSRPIWCESAGSCPQSDHESIGG